MPEVGNPYRDGRASYGKHTVGAATALIGIAVSTLPSGSETGGPEAVVARLGSDGGPDRQAGLLEGDPQVVGVAG